MTVLRCLPLAIYYVQRYISIEEPFQGPRRNDSLFEQSDKNARKKCKKDTDYIAYVLL